MDDPDLLEGENRVTYLGEKGQYVFDWIDKNKRTVLFNTVRSDFDHVDEKIANKLKQNNIYIEDSEEADETVVKSQKSDTDEDPLADPDGGVTVDSESDNIVVSEPMRDKKPFDDALGSENPTSIDRNESASENPNNNDFEELLVEDDQNNNTKTNNTNQNKGKDGDSDAIDDATEDAENNQAYPKHVTFTAEISDLESKSETIQEIIDDKKVKAKLESGGPYEITYEISQSGSIEIVRIEDLVLDAELSE